jgi:uncharacterized delta-60 repeat protein
MRQFVILTFLLGSALGEWKLRADEPVRPQDLDPTFHFGVTNATEMRDIELFPDGSIAYGAAGASQAIGRLDENGGVLGLNFAGGGLDVLDVEVDEKDLAIFAGGAFQFGGPVRRVVNGFEDSSWQIRINFGGTARKVLVRKPQRDVIAAGRLTVPGVTNEFYGFVRLQRTGAIDPTFDYRGSAGLEVLDAVLLEDGRILASYTRTNESGQVLYGLGRWEPNGARDTTYGNAEMNERRVSVLKRAPGKHLIAAVQENLATGTITKLVPLNETGQGAAVNPFENLSIGGEVNDLGFETVRYQSVTNGTYDNIIVVGSFGNVAGIPCNNLAAISKAGFLEWCFSTNEGPDGPIRAVEVQLNGKVLIGGAFTNVSGVAAKGMARLAGNSGSGQTYLYWADEEFREFEKLGQGTMRLVRSGNTNEALAVFLSESASWGESNRPIIPARVDFAPGETVVEVAVPIPNDQVRQNRRRYSVQASVVGTNVLITRPEGELVILDDETPGTLQPEPVVPAGTRVSNYAVQPDGKILVAFGTTLTRFDTNGSVDATFVTNGIPALPGSWSLQRIEPQADGKIYVSGRFNTTNTFGINHLARLNSDGTLDVSFDPKLSAATSATSVGSYVIFDLHLDGRVAVLILGSGSGITRQLSTAKLFRLTATGALDNSFNTTQAARDVGDLMHLPNGELLVYSDMGGTIRRLGTNGALNTNFLVNVPVSRGYVYHFKGVGDALWVGGSFKEINSLAISNLARVNLTNGIVDTNFVVNLDDEVTDIREHDGKIFLAGGFTKVNGADRFRVARLNLDGSLDTTFDPGLGPNLRPGKIEPEADGDLLVGINVVRVDGIDTEQLVRLEGDKPFLPGLPPVVEILTPTNGMVIEMSDVVVPLEIRVRTADPDGNLRQVVVELDGVAISTNTATGEFVVSTEMPREGEHALKVTASDQAGLTNSETVKFRVRVIPFPGPLQVRRVGNEIIISYTGGTLQASADLRAWAPVQSGGGEFRANLSERYQFFRVRF